MHGPVITSVHNARVKQAARLRQRRGRQTQGRIIIDGRRELRAALAGGVELVELFVCQADIETPECEELAAATEKRGAEVIVVAGSVFEKLAFGQRAEAVVGVARTPRTALAELRLPDDPLVVVLEGVEKPGNVGAVVRTADAAGASAVIVADGGTDLLNPNAIRASLGTIFTVPLAAAPRDEVIGWLDARAIRIVAARVEGSVEYTTVDLRGPTAIVLGSESQGLSEAWSREDMIAARLPMLGAADSLNVSATAAVLLYEARRQRGSTR